MQEALGDPPDLTLLSAFEDVIDELGGITQVSKLTKRSRTAVCNWRAAGLFPASQYLIIQQALGEMECTANPRLFTFQAEEPPPLIDRAVCA